jgi:hypothetical protein
MEGLPPNTLFPCSPRVVNYFALFSQFSPETRKVFTERREVLERLHNLKSCTAEIEDSILSAFLAVEV